MQLIVGDDFSSKTENRCGEEPIPEWTATPLLGDFKSTKSTTTNRRVDEAPFGMECHRFADVREVVTGPPREPDSSQLLQSGHVPLIASHVSAQPR